MGDNTAIVISDDEGSNNHDAEVNEPPLVKEEKKDGDMEADDELPNWLPDGWVMEVFLTEDGTENRYYSSPISDSTFTSRAEVLEFLFSRVDERILRSEKCAEEMTLQRAHQWLPPGWLIEVRAGGKNMDMMYKVQLNAISKLSRL
ncbi:hypothetical protein QOZ80_3AG0222430 [Eleusine coracana subsp. coracana]|nr:hypothetical protein QOZ80_3AG0222430 [Eleusine coracana subsp. coracana]